MNILAQGVSEAMGLDSDRMSAIDFVLSVLKEHERKLDFLIERLENAIRTFSVASGKTKTKHVKRDIKILCEEWSEFKVARRE